MALATYKDLCIDAIDPTRLGRFWAEVLGLTFESQANGDGYLSGPTPAHTIWVNGVPEPKTVKHRMHIDVNASSVEEIERLGATVLDADSFPWTLMADPEGGEFCVFVREGQITQPLYEIGIDTPDSPEAAHRIAAWWGNVLGVAVSDDDEHGYSYIENIPAAPFEGIFFAPVPEPKTVKNRIHLDVTTKDLDQLIAAGATLLRAQDDEIRWNVLADPDGNEFCAFVTE